MVAASVRAISIDVTKPGLLIKIDAIIIGISGQGENFSFVIEVADNPLLHQALGESLSWLFCFKGISQPHSY